MLVYRISFEEAVERISFMIDKVKMSQKDKYALIMARQSIQKQMPKKVEKIGAAYRCPDCKKIHSVDYFNDLAIVVPEKQYCNKCGQALDWSDTE